MAMLWSIDKTTRKLGGISRRTLCRLLDEGVILEKYIKGRRMVVKQSVKKYIDNISNNNQNRGAGNAIDGAISCQPQVKTASTDVKIVNTSGVRLSESTVKELDALLKPQTRMKRMKS